MSFSGIVLNGGASTRMGRDKSEIFYKGRRLLDIAIDSLLAADAYDVVIVGGVTKFNFTGERVTYCEDLFPNEGPLGGVITGLKSVKSDIAMILACDYLDVDRSLILECISKLDSRNMVFPVYEGKDQYLFSAIRVDTLHELELQFMKGVRSIHKATANLDCQSYESSSSGKLRSANTPSQLNED